METVAELQFIGDVLNQGFTVKLTVSRAGRQLVAVAGTLPPEPELADCLQTWHQHYRQMGDDSCRAGVKGFGNWRIKPKTIDRIGSIQRRRDACNQSAQQLRDRFLTWLETPSFQSISKRLRDVVSQDEPVQLLLRADDQRIEELPWHQWDFLAHRDRATYSFTPHRYVAPPVLNSCARLRVLVLLGQSDGLNTQADAALFDRLPARVAEVTCFPQRSSKDLMDKLWEQPWDVIVFAGHSRTVDGVGYIEINDTESLTITELWYALKQAVSQGLQLVIFNSCDGMELSHRLDDELSIPHLIVMRELVPDRVANAFLDYLLTALAAGLLLPHAVEQARQRLQSLEPEFPCATWLPILWQNPAAIPFHFPTSPPPPLPPRLPWRRVLATSLAVTCLVMGIRWLGWLQAAELAAFDRFMSLRPAEASDSRIAIVEIDQAYLNQVGGYLKFSDGELATAIKNLQAHDPAAIGVYISRATPRPPGREAFIEAFNQYENLVVSCSISRDSDDQASIDSGHPPEFSQMQVEQQVGFAGWEPEPDSRDVPRRQPLSYHADLVTQTSPCASQISFSFQLATLYLKGQGQRRQLVSYRGQEEFKVGDVVLPRLRNRTGGYQNLGDISQVLLNYRTNPRPGLRISFGDVLTGKIPDTVQGRVILISYTAESVQPDSPTPYGKLPNVWVEAHMVSQIISTVMDKRSLIWVLPQWGDFQWGDSLFVWIFGLLGGVIVWRIRSYLVLASSMVGVMGGLYALCWWSIIQAGWLPLIPAALVLFATSIAMVGFRYINTSKTRKENILER